MSGFTVSSAFRPYELNDEIWPAVGLSTVADPGSHVKVVGPAAIMLWSCTPRASDVPTTGIVIAGTPATVAAKKPTFGGLLL